MMGDLKPDRVKLDLDGRDASFIFSALWRYHENYPGGPTKERAARLLSSVGEAIKHAWLREQRGEQAVEYLVGTPEGHALADALDAERGA